jgi:hypothetical protein
MAKKAPGLYRWPHDRTPAYECFFKAIEERAGDVLRSFREELLPLFCEKRDQHDKMSKASVRESVGCAEATRAYRTALTNWMIDNHLVTREVIYGRLPETSDLSYCNLYRRLFAYRFTSPRKINQLHFARWIVLVAERTLSKWLRPATGRCNPAFGTQSGFDGCWQLPLPSLWTTFSRLPGHEKVLNAVRHMYPRDSENYHFSAVPRWLPMEESRDKCRERVLSALTEQLDAYLEEEDNRFKNRARLWESPTPIKHLHYEWLVQYRILGMTYERIAAVHKSLTGEQDTSRQTVSSGVHNAAETLIGTESNQWF